MVPKAAAVMLLACLATPGCKTTFTQTMHESTPPARPLPIWADWNAIKLARLENLYSKDSVDSMNNWFGTTRETAMKAPPCAKPAADLAPATAKTAAMANYRRCVAPYTSYQNIGLMLAEMHCGAYLSALSRAENHQRFARETTSDAGTAASAIMGLFKNATGVTSAVTTTFGLFENSFRNYEEAYLPEERVRNGIGIFQKARYQLLDNYQENPPGSLAIAEFRINYYASSCTLDWMRRLIDVSVDKANEDAQTEEIVNRMGGTLDASQ